MAATKVWGFNEEGFNRVLEATRRVLRTPTTGTKRRRQPPVLGGSGGGCDTQNTIWDINLLGAPTGGTFFLVVTVNSVTTNVTFNWNDSAATFKSTLAAGHSEIASADLDVTNGPFPNATMRVEFIGTLASTLILAPPSNYGSITGGSGRGIICQLAQRGHA